MQKDDEKKDCTQIATVCQRSQLESNVNLLPCNILSFVGDAVYSLFFRTKLIESGKKAEALTLIAGKMVSAVCQSFVLGEISQLLQEDEADVVRRCRNFRTNNKAKNASAVDYHRASGLEGLFGYLYLKKSDRLDVLLSAAFENAEKFASKSARSITK
jgi:ribonuclease-3 family protein